MARRGKNQFLLWHRSEHAWPAMEATLAQMPHSAGTLVSLEGRAMPLCRDDGSPVFVLVRCESEYRAVAECLLKCDADSLSLVVMDGLTSSEPPVATGFSTNRHTEDDAWMIVGKGTFDAVNDRWRLRRVQSTHPPTTSSAAEGVTSSPPSADSSRSGSVALADAIAWADDLAVNLEHAAPRERCAIARSLPNFVEDCIQAFGADAWRPLTAAAWSVWVTTYDENTAPMFAALRDGLARIGWPGADVFDQFVTWNWFDSSEPLSEFHDIDDLVRVLAGACAEGRVGDARAALQQIERCVSARCDCAQNS